MDSPCRTARDEDMDANDYRRVMRRYAAGVMVLTVRDGAGFHAVTVNSVTSVSLEPTLLLVCLDNAARSAQLVRAQQTFLLNILSGQQRELGKQFAFDGAARAAPERYAPHQRTASGELLLDDVLGYLECRVVNEYPGGDHSIFLAEVMQAHAAEKNANPLVYHDGRWRQVLD